MPNRRTRQGQGPVLKFAEINHKGPSPCYAKSSRNREHTQRVNFPQVKRRLLAYIREEAAKGDGSVVFSMRLYGQALGVSRHTAKCALKDLEAEGLVRIRTEWQDGFKRLKVTPKRTAQ